MRMDDEVKLTQEIIEYLGWDISKPKKSKEEIIYSGITPLMMGGKLCVMPDVDDHKGKFIKFRPLFNHKHNQILEQQLFDYDDVGNILIRSHKNGTFDGTLEDKYGGEMFTLTDYMSEIALKAAIFYRYHTGQDIGHYFNRKGR